MGTSMKKLLCKKRILIPLCIAILLCVFCIWYVNDYYHSDASVEKYLQGSDSVDVTEIQEGLFLDGVGTDVALIFYPGAKVEYTAYLPLFVELAEQGVDCFLVEMPCNLAIMGMNKADKIIEKYDYKQWYLAGHSLGGAMAANFASANPEEINALILLAAYPTKSLEQERLTVVSLYGSEDRVLNMEKLVEGREFMPENYTEICIDGGNHAWFGNYGEQDGDGVASISRKEQQTQTVETILEIGEN